MDGDQIIMGKLLVPKDMEILLLIQFRYLSLKWTQLK